jgi:hypothetical protein
MIARYSQYNQLSSAIEFFHSRTNDLRYRYHTSDLLHSYLHAQNSNLESSTRRAIATIRLTRIPVNQHLKRIYRSHIKVLSGYLRLSELAFGLIILILMKSMMMPGKSNKVFLDT